MKSAEMQNEIIKKEVHLCWISFSYTWKSYSIQMKRFVLEIYFSERFEVFYTVWYAFLHECESYLVVQILEGCLFLLRNPVCGIVTG